MLLLAAVVVPSLGAASSPPAELAAEPLICIKQDGPISVGDVDLVELPPVCLL
jgi:hypothetical protein